MQRTTAPTGTAASEPVNPNAGAKGQLLEAEGDDLLNQMEALVQHVSGKSREREDEAEETSVPQGNAHWIVDADRGIARRGGIFWRRSMNLSDMVQAPDGSSMAENGTVVIGRCIDGAWVAANNGLYLPISVDGSKALWLHGPAGIAPPPVEAWLVDTSRECDAAHQHKYDGVKWRGSMNLDDRVKAPDGTHIVANGSIIRGTRKSDPSGAEWVVTDNGLLLPVAVRGATVLWPADVARLQTIAPAAGGRVRCSVAEPVLGHDEQEKNWL